MRFTDFTRATRSHTLARATTATKAILDAARLLFSEVQPLIQERGLTLIGLSVGNLDRDGFVQMELPFERQDRRCLDNTLDEIRKRFGSSAVTRGALVGKDSGMIMPMLPD